LKKNKAYKSKLTSYSKQVLKVYHEFIEFERLSQILGGTQFSTSREIINGEHGHILVFGETQPRISGETFWIEKVDTFWFLERYNPGF